MLGLQARAVFLYSRNHFKEKTVTLLRASRRCIGREVGLHVANC